MGVALSSVNGGDSEESEENEFFDAQDNDHDLIEDLCFEEEKTVHMNIILDTLSRSLHPDEHKPQVTASVTVREKRVIY